MILDGQAIRQHPDQVTHDTITAFL